MKKYWSEKITSIIVIQRFFKPVSLTVFFCLFLSACGFKPSGIADFPKDFQSVYVDTSANKPLATLTSKLIMRNGIDIVSKEDALIHVLISPMQRSERLIALSNNGAVKERERKYYATVRVIDAKTQEVKASRNVETNRFFQSDDKKKLSSPEKERIVREFATRELAGDILRYLSTVTM